MPGVLRVFAEHQPITILVNAVRGLYLEGSAGSYGWQGVLWCVGIVLVFMPLSAAMYRRRTGG
jgi:ABC-2 type transport system permease protein